MAANFGSLAPSEMSIFSFQSGGVTVSQAGVPASAPGAAFRVYVEANGTGGQPHSVRSGIALTNISGRDTVVSLELAALDGTATGLTESLTIPARGQVARVIDGFFPELTMPFSGIPRIASTAPDIAVVGLRMTRNQRNEVVVTATPPSDENSPPHRIRLVLPLFGGFRRMDDAIHPLRRFHGPGLVRIAPIHGAERPAAGVVVGTGGGSNDSLKERLQLGAVLSSLSVQKPPCDRGVKHAVLSGV